MLGETTSKNHSAVKKVVPKTGTLLSRGNRRIRGNCFSVFQKSLRDNCSRSATAALRCVIPACSSRHRAHSTQTQQTQSTHKANTHTDPQTHTEQTHTHTHGHARRDPQNSFTKPRLHKAQAHTHILRVLPKSGQGIGDFLFCVSRLGCRALLCTPTKSLLFFIFLFL